MSAFEKQGFEIIPEFFDRERIASVSKSLDEMPLRRGRAGARNVLRIKSVRYLAADSRLTNIASSLLGGNAVPFRAKLFNKSFATNWLSASGSFLFKSHVRNCSQAHTAH